MKDQRTIYINISDTTSAELKDYLSKIKDKIESGEFDNKLDYTRVADIKYDIKYVPIINGKPAYEIHPDCVYINNVKKVAELLNIDLKAEEKALAIKNLHANIYWFANEVGDIERYAKYLTLIDNAIPELVNKLYDDGYNVRVAKSAYSEIAFWGKDGKYYQQPIRILSQRLYVNSADSTTLADCVFKEITKDITDKEHQVISLYMPMYYGSRGSFAADDMFACWTTYFAITTVGSYKAGEEAEYETKSREITAEHEENLRYKYGTDDAGSTGVGSSLRGKD